MPHIIIEHGNTGTLDIKQLLEAVHKEAMMIEDFPVGGLRVRSYGADQCRVGDGHTDNGFVYVTIRIGQGRSVSTRKDIGQKLFAVLTKWSAELFAAECPFSLGLEIQEIDSELTWKKNNMHKLLKVRQND